jgi:hypothetical protein
MPHPSRRMSPRGRQGHTQQFANSTIKKLVSASDNFGNTNMKQQQLSTREIFDYLPFVNTNGNVYEFFKNVKNRQFPFTNIEDNQMQVGESMTIKRMWFTFMIKKISTGEILSVSTFDAVGVSGFYLSQFSWLNDNNRVLKNLSLTNQQPEYNRNAWSNVNNVFHLESDITIQPLIRFQCNLQAPLINLAPVDDQQFFIGCHTEGTGFLFAPKHTY